MSQFIEMFYGGKYTVDKLRKHIDVIRGVSYKPSDVYETHNENTSIVLRSNNIEGGQINFDDLVYVSTDRVSEFQLLSAGDIVMCGSNGSKKLVGKAAMLQSTPIAHTSFGAFCLGIRCKPTLVPEYLATYFQTSLYRDKIEQLGSGSNILNIKPDHIYNLEIPIPLYDEQMAFVTIVKQADKSEFVGCKSQFFEMFEGDEYPLIKLGDYTDLTWGDTNTTKNSYVTEGYLAYSASGPDGKLDHYDYDCEGIVLSAIGADCGKTWFASGKWSCIKNTIRFWSTFDDLDNRFLYFATREKDFWPRRGGAQPFIPQGDARNCSIPLPPICLQRKFVEIAEQADKSEFELRKSIEAIDQVIKSLINN